MKPISKERFYTYLLLGIAAGLSTIDTKGPKFQKAFGSVVNMLEKNEVVDGFHYDPVFSVWPDTEQMLLYGMRNLLIEFDSNWRIARFRVTKEDALNEIQKVENFERFLGLASSFIEVMRE